MFFATPSPPALCSAPVVVPVESVVLDVVTAPLALTADAVRVPVSVGDADITTLPLPVTAFTPQQSTGGPPPLARQFSAAVIEIPEELRRAPSPSGVFQVPTGPPPVAGAAARAGAAAPGRGSAGRPSLIRLRQRAH